MIYEEIFRALNAHKVKYVVVGGIALVLHGVVRLTADLDLIVRLEKENLLRFISVMHGLGYKPKMPVKAEEFIDDENRAKWRREKNMQVFSFYHPKKPLGLIDVFVEEPMPYREMDRDKEMIRVGNLKIPVISKKHLMALKRLSGRPQDIADINALKEVMKVEKEEHKSRD
jgi:hypothetical protein